MKVPSVTPPKWPLRLLRFFLKEAFLEEIEGDMEEIFYDNLEVCSEQKARRLYTWEALKLFRPILLKNFSFTRSINHYDMFKHNVTISLRNFARYKSTFLINLIGLTTGLACFLLIYLWVQDEWQTDKFHAKSEQIYQILEHYDQGGDIGTTTNTSGATGPAMVEDMPEVLASVTARTKSINPVTLGLEEKGTYLKADGLFASKDFFSVFSFNLLQGQPEQVLNNPTSIIISEELALQLFGQTHDVIGKEIKWQQEFPVQVSGIFEAIPKQSSLQFDFVVSFEAWAEQNSWVYDWGNSHPQTFLLMQPDTDIEQFNEKIADYIAIKTEGEDDHRTPIVAKYVDQYLYGTYENGVQAGGRISYVWLFSTIAFFILLIACINFMNLATAKATRRIKEVGIKKAIGARRTSLIFQYLSESTLIATFALILAVILVIIFLPEFNRITGKQIQLVWSQSLIFLLLGIVILTGLLAGSYPAIYLSGLRPILIVKGKLSQSSGAFLLRQGLVVFQYALSVILMVAVWVVYQQIAFTQNQNLGYKRDNIIIFEKEGRMQSPENAHAFLQEVERLSGVTNTCAINNKMTESDYGTNSISWAGKDPEDRASFEVIEVDYNAIDLLGIEMEEGRNFSPDFGADSAAVIFNKAAIERMGMTGSVVGTKVQWGRDYEIIGVTKNFNYESFHEEVDPLVFYLGPYGRYLMIKLNGANTKQTISEITELYREANPGFNLDYAFLDENYAALYEAEQRVATLSKYFAGLAILISCLGLFGLAMFTAARRQKEIGIRKVLGANSYQIIGLLSEDFVKMVGLAIFVGLPISYFLVKGWLEQFAFSISLQWWYFLGVGALTMLIALFTVSIQTAAATRVNPVESLRDE